MLNGKKKYIEGEELERLNALILPIFKTVVKMGAEQIDIAIEQGIDANVFAAQLCSTMVRLACMYQHQEILLAMDADGDESWRNFPLPSQDERDELAQQAYLDLAETVEKFFNNKLKERN